MSACSEHPRGTRGKQEDVLYLHVKQYCPQDNPNPQPSDAIITSAHGNGFVKIRLSTVSLLLISFAKA